MAKRQNKLTKLLISTHETSIGNRDIRQFLKPFHEFSNENFSKNIESSLRLASDSRDDMSTKFESRSDVSISKERQMRLTEVCLKIHIPEEKLKNFKGLNIKPEDPEKGLRRLESMEGSDKILNNGRSDLRKRKTKNNDSRGKMVSKTKKVKGDKDRLKQEQINKYLCKKLQKEGQIEHAEKMESPPLVIYHSSG